MTQPERRPEPMRGGNTERLPSVEFARAGRTLGGMGTPIAPLPMSRAVRLAVLAVAIAVAACSSQGPASATPPVESATPTPVPTQRPSALASPSPTPGPSADVALTTGQQALADLLPADLAAGCAAATTTTRGFVDGVVCAGPGVAVTLAHFRINANAAYDQFDPDTFGQKLNSCARSDRVMGRYGIGARLGGQAGGCKGGAWLSWYVVATGIYGRVDVTGGALKDAIDWFVQRHPTGQDGPVYGAGTDPIIPRLSYAKLADVAQVVAYKTLLQKTAAYQNHLVRFSGEVKVDGAQARVWVNRGRTGLLDDLVSLDTTDLDVRFDVGDKFDFVGFVNGTAAAGVGNIPIITLLSYRSR